MIKVNLAEFHASWTEFLLEESKKILAVYRGLAAEIFQYLLLETPEYTGNVAANWTLHGAHPVYSGASWVKQAYEAQPKGTRKPWSKQGGSPGPNPVSIDTAEAFLHDDGLPSVTTLAEPIYIGNNSPWDGKGNVGDIVRGKPNWLRDVNTGGAVPHQAYSYVSSKYSGVLDDQQLGALMRMAF